MKTMDVPEKGDEFSGPCGERLIILGVDIAVVFQVDGGIVQTIGNKDLDGFLESTTLVPVAPKAGEVWETRNAGRVLRVVVTGLLEAYDEPDVVFRLRGKESPIVLTLSDFVAEFRRLETDLY